MSRQSKEAKKKIIAKQYTAIRKGGGKGPAATVPKHGKRWTYRNNEKTTAAREEAAKAFAAKKVRPTAIEKVMTGQSLVV
jgi:hypothetical protein